MALTRARPVFGSAEARARVQAAIDATLRRTRDDATTTADAVRMRGEIARHKPAAGPFDVKLIDGGLVDAEFAVQLSQLRHGLVLGPAFDPAARHLEEAGLLALGFADAAALLTRMLITLRLVAPGSDEPADQSRAVVARACGAADWNALLDLYGQARTLIAGEWRRVARLV
jgi:glutamate-ammonia-ligase adenylyltransferase